MDENFQVTANDVSKIFGFSLMYVSKMKKEAGSKIKTNGKYIDLPSFAQYMVKRTQKDSSDTEQLKNRKLLAEAELKETQVMVQRLQLVEADYVISVVAEVIQNSKQKLLSISPKLAGLMETAKGTKTKKKIIDECIREALQEISELQPEAFIKSIKSVDTSVESTADEAD